MRRIARFCMLVIAPASACFAAPDALHTDISVPEQRASVGLVIPFGGRNRNPDHKPRLQLSFDTRLPQNYRLSEQSVQRTERFRSSKIGFTLASNPEIYLNGRQISAVQRRANISTLGWVGIGAAVLVTGVVLVGYEVLDDASE